jgi:hypothetical protein
MVRQETAGGWFVGMGSESAAVSYWRHPRVGDHQALQFLERVRAVLHHRGQVAANRQPRAGTIFCGSPRVSVGP